MKRLVQSGITLFELVSVMVVISVLLSLLIPKYIYIQQQTRIAKLLQAHAAIASAAVIVNGSYLARKGHPDSIACNQTGRAADNVTQLCMHYGLLNIVNGYPQALLPNQGIGIVFASGIGAYQALSQEDYFKLGYVFQGGGKQENSQLMIQIVGGRDPQSCSFIYSPMEPSVQKIHKLETAGC